MLTVGNLNLLIASVVLVDMESLQIVRHMIGGTRVQVPVGVAVEAAVAGVGVVGGGAI
jgi:predicted membrane protein